MNNRISEWVLWFDQDYLCIAHDVTQYQSILYIYG